MPRHPTPANLVIRAAGAQDSEGLAALVNLPGFRDGTMQLPYRTAEEARTKQANAPHGSVGLIIAELEGAIVGSASLTPFSGRRAHAGGIGIGVHDDWCGHGIGQGLLATLIDVVDKWLGLRRLELTVYADNIAAIGLYQKFGFEIEGMHRAFDLRAGILMDAYAMARIVPPAPMQQTPRADGVPIATIMV